MPRFSPLTIAAVATLALTATFGGVYFLHAHEAPVQGSGTSRLPQAEGMMPGLHFDAGGGWSGMAHGFLWGVYTDQSGPRGNDKLYVQSMAMLMAEKDLGAARLVAMNMALDGASRAQITAQITAEFSAVGNVEILVDDVIRRASR